MKEHGGCATVRALPNVTRGTELLQTCPPRMWHIVESRNLRLYDLQVHWAGYWTLHFQFSDQILVEGIHLWNPSNKTFNGPNGDGIDIDSSTNALVRDSIIDAADDAVCTLHGAFELEARVENPKLGRIDVARHDVDGELPLVERARRRAPQPAVELHRRLRPRAGVGRHLRRRTL